ncbi:MAG: glycine/sarcosine/betaine reductase complex component C subunit beta [Clostridia bacterium]|nr:glycine/sarcosine/betaine reductase complex component C subunit beta [Clostridia bacterium]
MDYPVIRGVSYALVHAPSLLLEMGTTQTMEREANPDSEYLKELPKHLRTYEQCMSYPPNQAYIGNITPAELAGIARPWHGKPLEGAKRVGRYGEVLPEDEFYGLMRIVDSFDLVALEESFAKGIAAAMAASPVWRESDSARLGSGAPTEEIEHLVRDAHAEPLYSAGRLVGCVRAAHERDRNLSSHVMMENLAAKASGVLALRRLIHNMGIDAGEIDYIIECSEEACGDMNQRGGGNFAKAVGEMAGCVNATGCDVRGFCAAPSHALVNAASLVKAGVFRNVAVVAGGATAKLGMNGRDHVNKGLPILEDVLGAFAVLVSANDGVSPIIRTDAVGRHTIGSGSSPQAVMTAIVVEPLERVGLKLSDVDKYSPEMQNPEITEPAGAGDVPKANVKMIAALAVKKGEIARTDINAFVEAKSLPGFAPTQGHIPSGVPLIGYFREELMAGRMRRAQIIGKGSLFLGRMTNLFDGVSFLLEPNPGDSGAAEAGHTTGCCGGGAAGPGVGTGLELGPGRGLGPRLGLEAGFGPGHAARKPRIGLTVLGSEHGPEEIIRGAELAAKSCSDLEVVLIGPRGAHCAADEHEQHRRMEELLDSGEIDACVTMHYSFPIGVSTVGRVVTPGRGREMFIATTTGTSGTDRVENMIKNAVYGVAAAKACGVAEPTVGILNVDGARQVERGLRRLAEAGYAVSFAGSARSDGGAVMRGNDLLMGSPDVMVCDTLTGNLLMKIFSAFTTGGDYEASGYGYGPGVGEGYNRIIMILSRASGAPVVAAAIRYAADLVNGRLREVAAAEFAAARGAGWPAVTGTDKAKAEAGCAASAGADGSAHAEAAAPPTKVTTHEITGVDILQLDEAVQALWAAGIYASTGMGCTGPVVMVAHEDTESAKETLVRSGYL